MSDTFVNSLIKTAVTKLTLCFVVIALVSEKKPLPLVDKLGHLFLHLFALQLLLQKNLEARHRGGPLGVLLVGLRKRRASFKSNRGPINNHTDRASSHTSLLFGFESV